jgi:hypothetical protein
MLLRGVLWVGLSLVLHAALFAVVVLRAPELPVTAAAPELWMEAAPPPVAEPPPAPPPVVTPPSPAPTRSARAPRAPKSAAPPVSAAPELTAPVVDGPSSVAVTAGAGVNAVGSTGSPSDGRGRASTGGGAHEAERKPGPAQLSLWLEPARLDSLALARPTIALLMAMPGYADVLRGSGIRPLLDLQRLRLRLAGLAPERLVVAGVHHEGDRALVAAAERVAAMRDQAPVWRGDDDFRATSWVD